MAAAAVLFIAVVTWFFGIGQFALASPATAGPTEAPVFDAAWMNPVQEPHDVPAGSAAAALASLQVKGRVSKNGYTRESFGQAWEDADHNGCDTRNDILRRDLTASRFTEGSRCAIAGGTLLEPYTGRSLNFSRGGDTSAAVQIDHVVALADAWQKGAQGLTPAQRRTLANDPLNLIAVDGDANQEKGAGDAATWLPASKSIRCHYVARQISVKAAYGLWVTQGERDAMARVLDSCPAQSTLTAG